ncbi:peptidylprolyl isomerase [Siphonobacter sp. SORGH_AS_0500]|uniref:peptidylprolyl isomerase n=1 Tax=Siphonobacter sp. SORGH_AS_0500 TaxID=1864824 RepID=UPI000CA73D18|nr:peptidylprolyl isomerase [Siphonobacter sp. SORGH_AS_0500]MDR6195982.1 peptidyl-prolyl cis-trans isomerase SurA [Siphonobacter sp. SORGH_AS_0500]PKK37340.1 peptidylprolyl isomerase [Siphonobacter sp. SORGH_AS_0500]
MKKLFGLLLLFLPVLGFAQATKGKVIDGVISKVDNHYILRSDLDQMYYQYQNENQKNPPSKCQCLNSLIINKVMLAKAEIDSVTVEDRQVDGELEGRMDQMIQMYGSQKNIVEQFGKSIEQLKAELRSDVRNNLLVQEMQRKITSDVKITPNEVRKFFNSIPKDSLPYFPSEVQVGHIIRLAEVTKEETDALKQRLLEYKKRALAGEDFAQLAITYSEDLGSAQSGGLYQNVKRGTMVSEFEGAVYRLKPGEYSDPVETEYGVHLIKLEDMKGEVYTARHILLRPDYNRLDVTKATKYLDSVRTLLVDNKITFEKAAKEFSEDKATADVGGWIQDPETRSTRLALDETMDHSLYFTLDSMQVGTYSTILPYRSGDGKVGVRIIYYKAKYPPHYANLEEDYQKLQKIALSRKRNNAVEKWFKKTKAEVFIQVRDEELKTECSDVVAAYGQQ